MKAAMESGSRLSYGQQALWYLNQVEPASTAYHLGICLRLTGSLDEHALASAWADIGMAHPQLRARFILRDGEAKDVYAWTVDSGVRPLRPGEMTNFTTRVASPPEGAEAVQIRFARIGEIGSNAIP